MIFTAKNNSLALAGKTICVAAAAAAITLASCSKDEPAPHRTAPAQPQTGAAVVLSVDTAWAGTDTYTP
ncbi:MAG: hypothetical protein IJQ44_05935 [Bacteroidaceae bacterium]|nr:hypothetical protein [Bacteroidaceae bacterium]